MLDRARKTFGRRESTGAQEYEPLNGSSEEPTALDGSSILSGQGEVPFSWVEYGIFMLLGVAMLWAW